MILGIGIGLGIALTAVVLFLMWVNGNVGPWR